MRWVGVVVFLLVAAGLGFKAYQNSRVPHPADQIARDVACKEISTCVRPAPSRIDTSGFVREYEFEVSDGEVVVECRWSALLFGQVKCKGDLIQGAGPETDAAQYPHEIQRTLE
jgi:hypothetical protein